PSGGTGTHAARVLQALAGAVCWRRVGRIDLLHRGIRTGRTARFHRLVATGQRWLGLPAWFSKRRAPQLHPFAPSVYVLGVESPVPARHSGRHSRGLSPLAAPRHAQVHRDRAAGGSRQGPLIEAFTKYRREALTIFGLTLHNTVAYYIPIIY